MPSERISKSMIIDLMYMFESIEHDVSNVDFYDNLEIAHRNEGRLTLLAAEYAALPAEVIELWFDEASEVYSILTNLINEDEEF